MKLSLCFLVSSSMAGYESKWEITALCTKLCYVFHGAHLLYCVMCMLLL